MASSFKGWGTSWGGSWGTVSTDPNAMVGSASIAFAATGTLTGFEETVTRNRGSSKAKPAIKQAVIDDEEVLEIISMIMYEMC